jgi:hypothetical protein
VAPRMARKDHGTHVRIPAHMHTSLVRDARHFPRLLRVHFFFKFLDERLLGTSNWRTTAVRALHLDTGCSILIVDLMCLCACGFVDGIFVVFNLLSMRYRVRTIT